MKQELLTLGEHMGSFPAFCGITECCSYFLVVCVVFLTLFVYSIIVPNISCVSGMSTGACNSCQSRDKKIVTNPHGLSGPFNAPSSSSSNKYRTALWHIHRAFKSNQKVLFKVGTFYNNQHKLSRAFQTDTIHVNILSMHKQ